MNSESIIIGCSSEITRGSGKDFFDVLFRSGRDHFSHESAKFLVRNIYGTKETPVSRWRLMLISKMLQESLASVELTATFSAFG